MPRATADLKSTHRKDLKTCPPDGYVELKMLDFGKQIYRQQLASQMKMTAERDAEFAGMMDLTNKEAIFFEFEHAVADHNLEDENGNKLNFKKASDIERLHPKIGQEIRDLIREMNDLEDLDDPNSEKNSGQSSTETKSPQMTLASSS